MASHYLAFIIIYHINHPIDASQHCYSQYNTYAHVVLLTWQLIRSCGGRAVITQSVRVPLPSGQD